MSLTKQLLFPERKFSAADASLNWTRIQTLVHGPGASDVLAGEGGAEFNSAVFSCLMAICTAATEAPVIVVKDVGGSEELVENHALTELLEKPTPNGELTINELWFWTEWAKHAHGNAYWLKVRSGNAETGNVVQLWPISPLVMKPFTRKGSNDWISYYAHETEPGQWEPVPVQNVVHFRLGMDDRDHRIGLAPLRRLVRLIATDDEADRYVETLLRNYAIPGLVLTANEGVSINDEEALGIVAAFRRKFSGDRRGEVAVINKNLKMTQFGFNPEQMNISALHRIPEERVSAVLGVPAIVAGLGAGLERATYDNARSMGEWFTERKLIPLWRNNAARLTVSLLPDFDNKPGVRVTHDLTNVRSLQEDEDAKYARLNLGVMGGWVLRNEARADVGLPPVEGWDEEDTAPKPDPLELFSSNGNGPADDEDDDEGGAKSHDAPFRRWQGYP